MHFYFLSALLAVVLLLPSSAHASLPYYNQDLGYTIWLGEGWQVASPSQLSRFHDFYDGVAAHGVGWKAGYTLESSGASLLVSELHGRVVSKTSISNFNQYVVRELQRLSAAKDWPGQSQVRLNKASFDKRKNMLRLEMDTTDSAGRQFVSVVYIVYTSGCMLKFVGLADQGDIQSVAAIDAAVSSLYLDYGLRQETVGVLQ